MKKGSVMELFRDYEGFCRKYNLFPSFKGFRDWCNAELEEDREQEQENRMVVSE